MSRKCDVKLFEVPLKVPGWPDLHHVGSIIRNGVKGNLLQIRKQYFVQWEDDLKTIIHRIDGRIIAGAVGRGGRPRKGAQPVKAIYLPGEWVDFAATLGGGDAASVIIQMLRERKEKS